MRYLKSLILSLLVGTNMPVHAAADKVFSVSSGTAKVQLIELFTSEGCSSCPPADKWLSKYMHNDGLWTRYVPVAFHVDYWDYIGWEDRFASPAYTQQQYSYRRSGATSRVYTPQFVVNGKEWSGWFRRIIPGLGALPEQQQPAGELSLTIQQGQVQAIFDADKLQVENTLLHVALLASDIQTQVTRGENHGRVLEHDFVVLSHQQYSGDKPSDIAQWQGPAPRIPAIAAEAGRLAWAAWLVDKTTAATLQAVGGWIK